MPDGPRVWRDSAGEPWIEVAPHKVISLDYLVRQRLLEKFGAADLADVESGFELRLLVPESDQ